MIMTALLALKVVCLFSSVAIISANTSSSYRVVKDATEFAAADTASASEAETAEAFLSSIIKEEKKIRYERKNDNSYLDDHDHPDRIQSLPGCNKHDLSTPWYSGYLTYELVDNNDVHDDDDDDDDNDDIDDSGDERKNEKNKKDGNKVTVVHTHYIYIESEGRGIGAAEPNKENNPNDNEKKPILYWSNGGPGASSMFGLLTELGPVLLSDLSLRTESYKQSGIPTPLNNVYSWTNIGSLLIFDQPAPVGFSYCGNNSTSTTNCGSWNDERASLNSYMALEKFYAKFPNLRKRPLYLIGESYAGIYIPTLARRILENNRGKKDDIEKINFSGFAVGDACLGTETPVCGHGGKDSKGELYFKVMFLAGHGQMPYSTHQLVMNACFGGGKELQTSGMEELTLRDNSSCKEAIDLMNEQVGGYFTFSLYDECTYRNGLAANVVVDGGTGTLTGGDVHDLAIFDGALNDYPCGGGPVMTQYLTLPIVKEAFHIPLNTTFFDVDDAIGFDYTSTEKDLSDFYKDVVHGKYNDATVGNVKLRVLVYNGDTDPSITSFAAQNWTSSLGLNETSSWRPWTIDNCKFVGGYVTQYENGLFDFLTVRGAGHMVPTYKPQASLVFLKSWIENEGNYPKYDKHCKAPSSPSPSSSQAQQNNNNKHTQKLSRK